MGKVPSLADQAVAVALFYEGCRETAPNRGPYVDLFVRSVGIDPDEFQAMHGKGPSWCACFVYHCLQRAAASLQVNNPAPRTAGVHKLFARSQAFHQREPKAGDVFGIDHGRGLGHTGFVTDVDGEWFRTIEGNTNEAGSREGDGVSQRRRRIDAATLGFLRFTAGAKDER